MEVYVVVPVFIAICATPSQFSFMRNEKCVSFSVAHNIVYFMERQLAKIVVVSHRVLMPTQ